MVEKVTNKGAQWSLIAGGLADIADISANANLNLMEVPAGFLVKNTTVDVEVASDGTAPTVQVVMVDSDGSNSVELHAATATDSVARSTTHNDAVARTTAPKYVRAVLGGTAAPTTGKFRFDVEMYKPGRANEVIE